MRYEVLDRAGESTLWIVYRVRDRASAQVLALKALKTAFNRHTRFVDSVYDTSRQLLELSHPNLITIHEVGQEEKTLYLVTDWLSGGSLETRLAGAPLDRTGTLRLLRDSAAALAYLHAQGMSHGDVRPAQILCNEANSWVLTDCGVAAAFSAAGMATADVQPDAAYYLAPERTNGSPASAATDLYSLGVVLYRILTGVLPFDGPSPLAIALRQRSEAPRAPVELNANCDSDLEAISLNLLEKNPAQRPDANALLRALDGLPARAAPRLQGPSSRGPVTAAPGDTSPTSDSPLMPPDLAPAVASDSRVHRRVSPILDPDGPTAATGQVGNGSAAAAKPVKPANKVPDDPAARVRAHRWREFWGALGGVFIFALSLCALAGVFCYAYYSWVDNTPPELRVPNYLGMDRDAAASLLASADLSMRVDKVAFDPRKPAGTVLAGDPPPGKMVRSHREISVTVSQGQKPLGMYDFTQLTPERAQQIITQHGMKLAQIIQQYDDRIPAGFICNQFPEPGQPFHLSEPITLMVSRGPEGAQPQPTAAGDGTPPPPTPSTGATPNSSDPTATPAPTAPTGNVPLVTLAADISVSVPADGPDQEVRIEVIDANGTRTVYRRLRHAGEKVVKRVRVTHPQNGSATVKVYVGNSLIRQQSL